MVEYDDLEIKFNLKEELESYLTRLDGIFPEVRQGLRPGIEDPESLMLEPFPQKIMSHELIQLYQLYDGQNEDAFEEFVPGYRFMSFEEALKTYPRLRKNGLGCWSNFPIFMGENQDIAAATQSQDPIESQRKFVTDKWKTCSLWLADFEDPDVQAPVSDSIAHYFKTLNVAIDQGIVTVADQGTDNARFEVDEEAFDAVSRKFNANLDGWKDGAWDWRSTVSPDDIDW